jgi:hypothetical protein
LLIDTVAVHGQHIQQFFQHVKRNLRRIFVHVAPLVTTREAEALRLAEGAQSFQFLIPAR